LTNENAFFQHILVEDTDLTACEPCDEALGIVVVVQRDAGGAVRLVHSLHERAVGAVVDRHFAFDVTEDDLTAAVVEAAGGDLLVTDLGVPVI
jgi:hypothetical protein